VLLVAVVGVAAWCVVGAGAAVAAPGDLDVTFGGGDGIVLTDIAGNSDTGSAVVIDSEGRIVVAGRSDNGIDDDFAVVRYTSAGELDTSFSTDGIVTTAIGSSTDAGQAVVIDSQDRVVVAGIAWNGSDYDFAVVRYTSAGELDTSFGTGGKVVTDFGFGSDYGRAVVVDSAGRIIVAGYSDNGSDKDFAVVRYNGDGSLDTSFGTGGKVTTDIGSSGGDYGRAVAVDSQDRVIVVGYAFNGSNDDFAVVRYTPAGVLDASFGTGGIVTTAIGTSSDYGNAVVVDSAGRIIVAGYIVNGSDYDFAVVRYTSAGVLDTSFGTGGKVTTAVGTSSDGATGVAIDSEGRIVVAGWTDNGSSNDFAVVRYVGVLVPVGCTIVGTSGPDVLVGTGGDDHICGLGGDDRIYGKAGNDTLDGGPGNDRLFGQGGNDKIYGMAGNDTLDGGAGEDRLFGQGGSDALLGGTGRDTLYGGASNDRLYGGEGGDVLFGRGGADVLKGGPGNDRLYGQSGRDVLYGRDGNDRLVGGSHGDRLFGQSGWDTLYGGRGNDMLVGGIGDDTLYGQSGRDRLSGGMGRDFLSGGPSYDKLNGGPDADTAKAPGPDFLFSIEFIVP
jgi:uncharacterized delta-60 repeat protein